MEPNNHHNTKDNKPLSDREAAANILRTQVEGIYKQDQEALEPKNPYYKTYQNAEGPLTQNIDEYHSAWQDYYQKYYEGYYKHKSSQQILSSVEIENLDESKQDLLKRLKLDVKNKMRSGTKKVRHNRLFKPIAIGLAVMLIILLLQYYRVIQANVYAYVSPGAINPQNIVVNPLSDLTVSGEPRLIIPKINVDVPVVYDVANDSKSLMSAMDRGVAHFSIPGASSLPGEKGNTVLSGHSSNSVFDNNDYKFIFAGLDKLVPGDVIYVNYKGIRYTYAVTGKETVEPTDVNKLVIGNDKPVLTLVTCTPLGTARYRLLVMADQVSPDPGKATAPTSTSNQSSQMPGNTPTLFEWIASLFR